MKFSCIMTTYNDGELIRQSVDSVLNQTFESLELIIVDDGSAQHTKEILSSINDP
ncbi:glycosyltransferase, partial [Amphritea balenae]